MTKVQKIVGICGSLRKQSTNMMLLKSAGLIMQPKMKLEILPWAEVPMYSQDIQEKGMPKSVNEVYEKILHADGLLISTPEYNHSVPGGLKNLVDWLSRMQHVPFAKKPLAIMSASAAQSGGARAIDDLKKILSPFNPLFLHTPEV
jgi:chromate reductase, NAD(P)H dehydrogenase (quinone)